jgi:phage I-like protein
MDDLLAQLREVLGFEEPATAGDVLSRIRELLDCAASGSGGISTGQPDPARYVTMAQFQQALTELNQLRSERAREGSERMVDEALRAGKLVPAQREWAIAYCQADGRGFAGFISRQPSLLGAGRDLDLSGEPAYRGAGEMLNAIETAICNQLGIKMPDFRRSRAAKDDFLKLNKLFD